MTLALQLVFSRLTLRSATGTPQRGDPYQSKTGSEASSQPPGPCCSGGLTRAFDPTPNQVAASRCDATAQEGGTNGNMTLALRLIFRRLTLRSATGTPQRGDSYLWGANSSFGIRF